MIEVSNLSVSYRKGMPDIIKDMSFTLEKGCILNILGQNAVGKTTLIRTLMRELQGYRGSVKIGGREITSYTIREYAKVVGVVSTSFSMFQNLLVADYLVTGLINQMNPFSKPGKEYVQSAHEILASFGKQYLFNRQINQLSSGELQIVMIARVLLQNPSVIIVDEPTANLDVKNQIAVLSQIKRLSSQGYTIIVTSHNPGHARTMDGKTLIMGERKYSYGDTSEIIKEQTLSEYYELEVTSQTDNDAKCMIFRNPDDDEEVRLVF